MMEPNVDNPGQETPPHKARRQFLNSRRGDVKDSTFRTYKFPTKHFVQFCDKHEINSIGDVTNYVIESWKHNRKQEDIKQVTLHNNLKTLRVFIRWCESADLIEYGTADRMELPQVTREQLVSNETLPLELAEQVLRYLDTYKYATRKHAMLYTMWHIGCRISGAIALDVNDCELTGDGKILKLRDRKDTGTPLKNGPGGERNVTISDNLAGVLTDYIEMRRPDTTDEYDRKPLFCTENQRIQRQRAYKDFTALTRPCHVTDHCPHGREIEECEAAQLKKKSFGCPSSKALHPIRRGSITYHIDQGWPKEKLSERVDVSVEVLNKHYDARTKEQEREGRKQYLDLL